LILATIIVDEPGIGGSVIDALRRGENGLPVRAYNGGLPMKVGIDPDDDSHVPNVRMPVTGGTCAASWSWELIPLPDDEILLGQLTSLKFYYGTDEKMVARARTT
jgi:hypothetical protein